MVRDNALAASGLLNRTIGGPSVFPYQPPGLWEELSRGETFTAQEYHESTGPDLYRRSMYTFWKRTVPPAALTTFDAPDREKCTSRRLITNTPLQALVLLNDPTYVEAARALAQRAILEAPARCRMRALASCSAKRPRGAPSPAEATRPARPGAARARPLQERSGAGRETDRRRRVESQATWKPPNWPPGPRWPAPSSIWTKPSPRNKVMDITTASFLFAHQHRHRDRRARFAASAGRLRRGRDQRHRRAARACRISRPRPSASSSCTSRAVPRRWTCSITSRTLDKFPARNCPAACAWASASPA